jgi:hypothetical protein
MSSSDPHCLEGFSDESGVVRRAPNRVGKGRVPETGKVQRHDPEGGSQTVQDRGHRLDPSAAPVQDDDGITLAALHHTGRPASHLNDRLSLTRHGPSIAAAIVSS